MRPTPPAERPDLIAGLLKGDQRAWSAFVERYAPVIFGSVRKVLRRNGRDLDDAEDIAHEVFVRICRDDHRLLKQYDPGRASLSTWLTVISSSVTVDSLRRRRETSNIDDVPEEAAAVGPVERPGIRVPDGLLSPRQTLILQLLYDRELDVADIARMLNVDPQTVRSTHHKALVKLRAHFGNEE